MGFPDSSVGKESACNGGDLGSIPGLGRSPEEGKGYPLQYSGLENFMGCTVHGVAKSGTRLSDFHFFTNKGKEFKLSTSPYTQTLKKNCGRFEICPPFMGTVYITDVILII